MNSINHHHYSPSLLTIKPSSTPGLGLVTCRSHSPQGFNGRHVLSEMAVELLATGEPVVSVMKVVDDGGFMVA